MNGAPLPLALREVNKTYRTGASEVQAVRRADLSVGPGEIVAVVGPSGSGKTTLLSIAGCLLSPTRGTVEILGQDVTKLGQARLSLFRLRHIGFVFQAFNLLPALSAQENVEIVLNLAGTDGVAARDRAQDLLDRLEIAHLAARRPSDLSAGEQQRLAVCRALANHPEVLLADEPTANLDGHAGHRVMEAMRGAIEAGQALSLVVVTHDERILDLATRVVHMVDGTLEGASA